jgi:hypothetical protein
VKGRTKIGKKPEGGNPGNFTKGRLESAENVTPRKASIHRSLESAPELAMSHIFEMP